MRGKRKTINSNFSAGELDPKLVPMRSDVQAWQQGAKQIVNMRPLLHGGVQTRPGTAYVTTLPEDACLMPFEFSETQGYILAFRNGAIDIFYDNGAFATTVTGGSWDTSSARNIRYAQAGDTMILTHRGMAPQKLTRTGSASFVLAPLAFTVVASGRQSPFYRYAAPNITIQTSGLTGSVTAATSANVFDPAHVGYFFRIGGKQMIMTAFGNATNATFTVYETLPATATTPTTDWDEEAFSPVHGWPQAVCFHNERLVLAGSAHHPSGIWASQVGDFFNFDLADGTDDKAIWIGVAADKVVDILFLASFKHLAIFTDQVEMFQPEADNQPWSPKTAAIKAQTGFGCHQYVRPARFDDAVLFCQKYGHHIREFLYDAVAQTYTSDAISVMNPSRIDTPVSMTGITTSQDIDEQYAFIVMANGGMAVLHSLRAQRITAWSWWQTQGNYLQACAVNGNVFFTVRRVIGGSTVYHLELLDYAVAMDSTVAIPVTVGGTSASGIPHLNGQLAQAVNNGYAHNPVVVSGGVYQLTEDQWGGNSSLIGIPFVAMIESMPPEIQVDDGSSRGRPLRIVKAGVQVHESVRLVVDGEGAVITNIDDDYSVPPTPLTGMYDFVLLGFDKGKTVTVRCDVPLQLTVLGLALEVVV